MIIRIDVILDDSQWVGQETLLTKISDQITGYVHDGIAAQLWYRDGFKPDFDIEISRI